MSAKKKSGAASAKKELRHQWVLWYRGSICAELRKKPRSQSELFTGLARRDGRPNPKTRCHPALMPPPAATALEELVREKVVERERSDRFITFRLARKPAPFVKKPCLELRKFPTHVAPSGSGMRRAEKDKERRDKEIAKYSRKLLKKFAALEAQVNLLSQKVKALGSTRGRGGDIHGRAVKKLSKKATSLDTQVRRLSRQVKVYEKDRARHEGAVGITVQEFESRFVSLERQVRDSQKPGKDSDGDSSRLDDLDRRLGVFEEQVGRVARSVKAVVVEPRPAASETGGGS